MPSKVIRNITKVFRSASGVLFGRKTAGTGRGEELTPADVRTLLSVYTISQTDTAISTAVNTLIGGAPGLLDTLDELSAALGDDANFASTVTAALAGKVDSSSLSESIDDRVSALLVAGTNITITYNDASNTLTIASTGGGGIGGSTGPTDNRLLRADGTGEATAQSSAVTVDDSGNISGLGTVGCGAITSTGTSQIAQIGIGTASPDYPLHILKSTVSVASGFHLASSYANAGHTYVGDFGEYGCVISHQREPQVGTFVGNAVSPNQKRAVSMTIGGSYNTTYWNVAHFPAGVLTVLLSIDTNGKLKTRASTTAAATLNIPSGTAPTSPADGDIWSDGSNLKVRLGGVTYTLDKT